MSVDLKLLDASQLRAARNSKECRVRIASATLRPGQFRYDAAERELNGMAVGEDVKSFHHHRLLRTAGLATAAVSTTKATLSHKIKTVDK
jgi:hypothetical protein